MALVVNGQITIGEDELKEQYFSSSTAGGQHANKAATGVRLVFCAAVSLSLTPYVLRRLLEQAGSYMSKDGNLTVTSTKSRERERNRLDARIKLAALIANAAQRPKYRVATRPGKGAKVRRMDEKSKRSSTKKLRRKVGGQDD